MTTENKIKVTTDCSGMGALEESLNQMGVPYESVFASEIDAFARTTFLANHRTKMLYEDLTARDQATAPYCDFYFAGFPCQAFSLAGKRKGFEDVRGTIFFHCAEYIRIHRPPAFGFENVKGLLSHDKTDKKSKYGRTFNTIINLLAKTVNGQEQLPFYDDNLGYNIYFAVLNTKEHGLPQNRERIFIIGIRPDVDDNTFRFPKKIPLVLRLKDMLETHVDEKYYLSDQMLNYLFGRKKNFNGGKINFKQGEDIASAITSSSSSSSLDVSDNILVMNVGNTHPSGTGMNGNVFHEDGLAPTITTNKGEGLKVLVAGRDRSPEAKKERQDALKENEGEEGFQTKKLAFYESDVINTITTCTQKDNVIAVNSEQLSVNSENSTHHLPFTNHPAELILVGAIGDKDWVGDGKMLSRNIPQGQRVYDSEGIASTLSSQGGGQGGKTGLYLVENNQTPDVIRVPDRNAKGYLEATEGDSIHMKYLKSTTASGLVGKGIAATLDHNCNQAVVVPNQQPEIFDLFGNPQENPARVSETSNVDDPIAVKGDLLTRKNPERQNGFSQETMFFLRGAVEHGVITRNTEQGTANSELKKWRIRRLTPLECFRLQGFSDAFYERSKYESVQRSQEILAKYPNHKGKRIFNHVERIERMSDSQLYKQAGNSISLPPLVGILQSLIPIVQRYINKP